MQMGNQVLHVDIQIEKISKNVLENNLSSKAYIFVEVGLSGATMWGSSFTLGHNIIEKLLKTFFQHPQVGVDSSLFK